MAKIDEAYQRYAKQAMNRRRWWIVWTLFFSTAINYINRQTLSVFSSVDPQRTSTSPTHNFVQHLRIRSQIRLRGYYWRDPVAFFWTCWAPRAGWLAIAVIWWSLVSMVTSFANSTFSFGALRFLLGIGGDSIGQALAKLLPNSLDASGTKPRRLPSLIAVLALAAR